MGGEVFLSEQKCSLQGALHLPNMFVNLFQLHTMKRVACYFHSFLLNGSTADTMGNMSAYSHFFSHLQKNKNADLEQFWCVSVSESKQSPTLIKLLTPDANLRLYHSMISIGKTTV